ncbi:tetratricopeptide repeat protein [Mucilaginibacter litoreus]|uniref:Tetratricopeptide repeat protein n=1 Tax=Mucilaginibacter litoreus TaxID=1048221 RepID=A0ABW3ATR7_9SPHI
MSNIVRLIIACVIMGAGVTLCGFGFWGWGIPVFLIGGLTLLTFFFNENMLIAQFYLRKEKSDKAEEFLGKITDYEKQLHKGQWGYYNLLIGLIESRKAPLKAEKYFKKALSLGMSMSHNTALAKLSLAGISMAKRNKREAEMYIKEAAKDDKNKLLADQIKMMKAQMGQMDKQQVVRGFRQKF